MATEAALVARIRSELGDFAQPFRTTYRGDGVTDYFDLPATNVSSSSLIATLINNNIPTVLSPTPGTALATPVNAAFTTALTGGTLVPGTYSYRVAATNQYGNTLASAATSIAVTGMPPGVPVAPVQNATSTALTGGTFAAGTYYYKVTATNASGEGLPSNEQSRAVTGSTSTITVNWAAVTGATGYKIYRGTAAGAENVLVATVGAVTTFLDTGAAGTTGSPPVASVLNTVTVNWGAVTGATGYKVYGRTALSELLIATVGAVTTYIDTGAITPIGALPTVNNTYSGYILDAREGILDLVVPPPNGSTLMVEGTSTGLFTDDELKAYLHDALLQHTHGATSRVRYRDADGFIKYSERPVTLETLPEVEELLVAILASVEALWALSTDAATDIDISTAEGTFIGRSQRYAQIRSQIDVLTEKYTDLAQQLNVGLRRIEVVNLRRVSRTTGRLVPLYVEREFDDHTWPERILPPIDSKHSERDQDQGIQVVGDEPTTVDLDITAGDYFEMEVVFGFNLTGSTIQAATSGSGDRYGNTGPQYFTVIVTNAVSGIATLSLSPTQTSRISRYAGYDVQVTNAAGQIHTYLRGRINLTGQITPDGSLYTPPGEFNAWNVPGWTAQ